MWEALDECLSLGEQSCKCLVHISSMEVINHAQFLIVVIKTIWTLIWVRLWFKSTGRLTNKTLSRRHGFMLATTSNGWMGEINEISMATEPNMELLGLWENKGHKDAKTHPDGREDEVTDTVKRTDKETEGREEEGMTGVGQITDEGGESVLKRRETVRGRGMGGETAKRNHAWFTFDLSKGHGLPCGARARVRPLWAEQGVLIVLLVRVVGVVLRHGNWDGGGEELAPLPRILEAAERPRLLLIPYIYKQDRHKEKNCREIWAHKLKERKKWRR